VSAAPAPAPLALTSLYFGALAALGADEEPAAPCEVVAAPEEVVLDPAPGAVLVAPAADAPPAAGVAAVDRFVPELRCVGEAVDLLLRFLTGDEAVSGVSDVVPREDDVVLVERFVVVVAEGWRFAATFWIFFAEPLVFDTALVDLVVAKPVVAGLVAAGAAFAALGVAVLVVVVLDVVGAALAELVVVEPDGDAACCWATQVSYELIRDHSVQCAVLISAPWSS